MFLATTTLFDRDIPGALEQIMFIGKSPAPVLSHAFQYYDVAYSIAVCMLPVGEENLVMLCAQLQRSVGTIVAVVSRIRSINGEVPASAKLNLFSLVPIFITNPVATFAIGHTAW
ncbi:hypothetical protein C8J56DRAFT_1054002 [Mycena floridula]|nr:hypothetical protein C8J56DRAFT_1054002 [Mycena floridula]